jgi:hypothetical protein
MSLATDVCNIIHKIEALHLEDPGISKYWNELTEVFSANEVATIEFLRALEDEDAVARISSVFDDVASRLQSQAFIDCIESMVPKFPNLLLRHRVDAARDMMVESSQAT